jgi:hypothetical protein
MFLQYGYSNEVRVVENKNIERHWHKPSKIKINLIF